MQLPTLPPRILPTIYLLCGKVGAGKSTFAKQLALTGVHRFSMDERTLIKVKDLRMPNEYYRVEEKALRSAEREAKEEIRQLTTDLLRKKESVVIDDGFWRKEERAKYRELARNLGVECVLIYLKVQEEVQWQRLQGRNQGDLTHVHFISYDDIAFLNPFFEEPIDEDEIVVQQS